MPKQLIVNADDYGYTRGISLGIRQAHLNGIVTSTSAMMNSPTAAEAIRLAQSQCPNLGLGLHLTLTSGTPLLPANEVADLVDGEGQFHRSPAWLDESNPHHLAQVGREWHAQTAAFQAAAGGNPDHLDSHHHSSYFSAGLFALMLSLAEELDCAVRLPWGMADTIFADQPARSDGGCSQPASPQVFFSNFYDDGVSLAQLKEIIQRIDADQAHSTFELMCHPAVVDDEVRHASSYNDQRSLELALLQNLEIKTLLQQHDIELIRFADLP